MLVLSNPDRLRVNLDQFRQRILEPATNGDCTPLLDMQVWELIPGFLACGVNGGPRFVDNHVVNRAVNLLERRRHELFGLPAGSPVTDRNHLDVVLLQQVNELALRSGPLLLRCRIVGVDDRLSQEFTILVQDGKFTASPVGGVEAKHDLALDWCLHQQVVEVFTKNLDGLLVSVIR